MSTAAKSIVGVLVALAVVAGIVIGGYQLGWWLREQRVNRGAEIRRGSFEYQETRRDEIVRQSGLLADIDAQLANPDLTAEQSSALRAQREAVARQLCNIAADLIGYTAPDIDQIINRECSTNA